MSVDGKAMGFYCIGLYFCQGYSIVLFFVNGDFSRVAFSCCNVCSDTVVVPRFYLKLIIFLIFGSILCVWFYGKCNIISSFK